MEGTVTLEEALDLVRQGKHEFHLDRLRYLSL